MKERRLSLRGLDSWLITGCDEGLTGNALSLQVGDKEVGKSVAFRVPQSVFANPTICSMCLGEKDDDGCMCTCGPCHQGKHGKCDRDICECKYMRHLTSIGG